MKRLFFLICLAVTSLAQAQYCTPTYTNQCQSDDYIDGVRTTGGSTNIDNRNSACPGGTNYTFFSTMTVTAQQTQPVQVSLYNNPRSGEGYKIWVDWNQDGDFLDSSELVYESAGIIAASDSVSLSFIVPDNALPGTTRMRVRDAYNTTSFTPCSNQGYGETEDYNFTVVAAPPCSSAPTTSVTPAGPISSCVGGTVQLTAGTTVYRSGYQFKWQRADSCTGTFSDIPGAPNGRNFGFTVTGPGAYHVVARCANSSDSFVSSCVRVNAARISYVAPPYFQDFETWTNRCSTDDVPDSNFSNQPSTGDASWRREDEGFNANWQSSFSGTYFPSGQSGQHSARFHTYGLSGSSAGGAGDLSMYLNCSAAGNKQLSFWYNNDTSSYSNDSLVVMMSVNGGSSYTTLGTFAGTDGTWSHYTLPVASGSANTIIRFRAALNSGSYDYSDIGLDSVFVAQSCNSRPAAGFLNLSGTQPGCPGGTYTLFANGTTLAGDLTYQWLYSTTGNTTLQNAPGASATTDHYTTPPLGDTVTYLLVVRCATTGQTDTTDRVTFNVPKTKYAAVPYFQDFESWINRCSTNDLPDSNFTNQPTDGEASWRKYDEGFYAGWQNSSSGGYFPPGQSNNYSARFHSYGLSGTANIVPGDLSMYLNCASTPGSKLLSFWYNNDTTGYYSNDSLIVMLSTDAGNSFTTLGTFKGTGYNSWVQHTLPVNSTSATTVIKFRAALAPGAYDYSDIGLDSVYVGPPCSGRPVAGTLNPSGPVPGCPGTSYTLTSSGTTIAGDLSYQWIYRTPANPALQNAPGASATTDHYTTPALTDTITYFFVVRCNASGLNDTSNSVTFNVPRTTYAPIPHVEQFESWSSRCGINDIPSGYWSSLPADGNSSWHRNDEGDSASWTSPSFGFDGPQAQSGLHSARFHSYGVSSGFGASTPGVLDLHINATNGGTDPRALYFFYKNDTTYYHNDSLNVSMSTDAGVTFQPLRTFTGADTSWYRQRIPVNTSSATTVLRFRAKVADFSSDYTDIGIDSVYVALPCTGRPFAGVLNLNGPQIGCAGTSYTLYSNSTTLAGNLTYQWIYYPNNSNTPQLAPGPTATTPNYRTPALADTVRYRLVVKCLGSGLSDTSAPVIFNVPKPVYATLPFVESFENWTGRCYTNDVPSLSWTNFPARGPFSWRRNDQGLSAGWTPGGSYSPVAVNGAKSARWSSYNASNNSPYKTPGLLDLYVDCSTQPGMKQLAFYYIDNSSYSGDSLTVYISTNGGASFSRLTGAQTANTWTQRTVNFSSASAQTVIRFEAKLATSTYDLTDIGLDYVRITPSCSGTPTAGTVDVDPACPNRDFDLKLAGNTQGLGVSLQWQKSANGVTGWSTGSIVNANTDSARDNINTPYYYRCIVTCANAAAPNNTDTTPVKYVTIAPFFYCYCPSGASTANSADIGKVTMSLPSGDTVLNNGVDTPVVINSSATRTYTNFQYSVDTVLIFPDSLYRLRVAQISRGSFVASTVAAFIDYNRDGNFDSSTERVFLRNTNSAATSVTDSFRVPSQITPGLVGMRIVLREGAGSAPCGSYVNGETEDYLVNMNIPACNGTPDGGTTTISDTTMCPGYSITAINTTHQRNRLGVSWEWEQSNNSGATWVAVPGSAGRDTIVQPFTSSVLYRLRVTCVNSGSSGYSNAVSVKQKEPYKCYCYSTAAANASDSSDIGSFGIGDFIVYTGGPHLRNPSERGRTDYTDLPPVVLYIDSTYEVSVYHTLRGAVHTDARVTLFMDFNNNRQYDYQSAEAIYLSTPHPATDWRSSATNFVINDTVHIPRAVVPNVPTGMRAILTNDLGPNVPADQACGGYASGETMDFMVLFRPKTAASVEQELPGLDRLALYPNPTEGLFTLSFNASERIDALTVTLTDITGRQLKTEQFSNVTGNFSTRMNLGSQAKGVYLVEISADGRKTTRRIVLR